MKGRKAKFRTPEESLYDAIRHLRDFGVTGMVGATVVEKGPRCPGCGRKLAEYVPRPFRFRCSRCGLVLEAPPFPRD